MPKYKHNFKVDRLQPDLGRDKVVIADPDQEQPLEDENGEPIKRKSKLVTPRPKNTETLVSIVPTPGFDSVRIDHTPQPRGGLKALQDKGLRITSYIETDGSGAPITRRRYDDDEE
jgi:hypothetical protein